MYAGSFPDSLLELLAFLHTPVNSKNGGVVRQSGSEHSAGAPSTQVAFALLPTVNRKSREAGPSPASLRVQMQSFQPFHPISAIHDQIHLCVRSGMVNLMATKSHPIRHQHPSRVDKLISMHARPEFSRQRLHAIFKTSTHAFQNDSEIITQKHEWNARKHSKNQ